MHRTGIEPMSTAWKAAMLPLHQRCARTISGYISCIYSRYMIARDFCYFAMPISRR